MKDYEIHTHLMINKKLCGIPFFVADNSSIVELTVNDEMKVDETGLIHGGFIFGVADYAAMIAVNEPNVVLGGAEVSFKKPIVTGDALVAEAKVLTMTGQKRLVYVEIKRSKDIVFTGEFTCVIPDHHVLEQHDEP